MTPSILLTRNARECRALAGELATAAEAAPTEDDYAEISLKANHLEALADRCREDAHACDASGGGLSRARPHDRASDRRDFERRPLVIAGAVALLLALALPVSAQQSGSWELSGTVAFTPAPHGHSHTAGEDDDFSVSDLAGLLSMPQKVRVSGPVTTGLIAEELVFARCDVSPGFFGVVTVDDSCYTPADSGDWDPSPDDLPAAADQLAARLTDLEASGPGGIPTEIEDADGDTGCEVERTADSDTIVCRTAGGDRLTLSSSGVLTLTRATAAAPAMRVLGGATGSAQANSGELCVGAGGSGLNNCLGYDWNTNTAWVRPGNASDRLLLGSGLQTTLELRNDANAIFLKGVRLTPVASPPWACSVAADNGRSYIDDSGADCTCWGGTWQMTHNLSGSGSCA